MGKTYGKALATSGVALAAANAAFLAPLAFSSERGAATQPTSVSVPLPEMVLQTHNGTVSVRPAAHEGGSDLYEMTGYVAIVRAAAEVREFMLVSDMGLCPLCGEAGHGAALEVQLANPTQALEDGQRITVVGALESTDDTKSTRIVSARLL